MENGKLQKLNDLLSISVRNLSIRVFADAKSRNSFCWHFFGNLVVSENNKRRVVHPDQVFCSACLDATKKENDGVSFGLVKIKSYNRTVSTGNLTRHLRDKHQIHEVVRKTTLDEFLSPKSDKHKPSTSRTQVKPDMDNLAQDLALWYCKSLMPFDTMSDQGMVDFLTKYGITLDNLDAHSKETIKGPVLTELYETTLYSIMENIAREASRHCAIAVDSWTDHIRRLNYITFKLHYLTTEFQPKAVTLRTQIVNGANMETVIKNITKEFGLDGKNIHVVSDPGDNVKEVVTNCNMTYHACLGHGLHKLVVADGINSVPEIKTLVSKCKSIIKAIRHSYEDLEKDKNIEIFLREIDYIGELIEADELDPVLENDFTEQGTGYFEQRPFPATPSRWPVVLTMLGSIGGFGRDLINRSLARIGKEKFRITKTDWHLIGELQRFFNKFYETVLILTAEHTCTINVALVFRSELIDILKSTSDDDSEIIKRLKCIMAGNIDERLKITKTMVAAALLDSRFIGLKEIDSYLEAHGTTRVTFLASYIKEVICSNDLPQLDMMNDYNAASTSSDVSSILSKLVRKHCINVSNGEEDDPITKECWRYFASANPMEPEEGNLLFYWNTKKVHYPWLAAFANHILCVPVTCIPNESVFHTSGLEMVKKRARLSPVRVNKIIFVHDNYKERNFASFYPIFVGLS